MWKLQHRMYIYDTGKGDRGTNKPYWTLLSGLAGGVHITVGLLLLLNYGVLHLNDDDSLLDTSRAVEHIRIIAKKRRYVGTKPLEDSLQYIEREIVKMRSLAERNSMRLDVHTFRSGPASFATSVGKRYFINSYDDLPSVVARLRPSNLGEDTKEKALLINAHVDSAIGAFGANDNILGVGTTMELIRSLARMETSANALKRPVVFLFNGAEEAVLMAAHSFVTQHPWAPTIQAHINIESLGSGDSYFLFRLGPNNPWLAKAYARAVSVPSASVTATDIFSSKMIPAETDYRVFDEFGGIPGYDFVILDNGYIYHTDYDSVDNIDINAVKHGGFLFRELTLELAGKSDAIGAFLNGNEGPSRLQRLVSRLQLWAHFFKTEKDPSDLKVTFFDLLNKFTIAYDEIDAWVINSLVLFATAAIWAVKITGMGFRSFLRCIWMTLVLLTTLPASLASGSFAALVYSKGLDASLVWYGSWQKCFVLYAAPTFFGTLTALQVMLPRRVSVHSYDEMLFALTLLYVGVTILFMKINVMSSYIPMVLTLAANVCAIEGSAVHPVLRHLQLMLVNGIIGTKQLKYSLVSTLSLLGRIRSTAVPHDLIASVIVGVLALIHFIWAALPLLSHYALSLRRLQVLTFAACFGTALMVFGASGKLSNLYGSQYSKHSPKRIWANHFYSPQLEPKSVLWLAAWDPVSLKLDRILGQVEGSALHKEISPIPEWGSMDSTPFESFRAFRAFLQEVHVFEADNRPDLTLPSVTVAAEERIEFGWNITVSVEAPDSHGIAVRIMVGDDTPIKSWSFAARLQKTDEGAWVHHAGSPYLKFWMVVGETSVGSEERAKVPASVTCCRLGTSRSPDVLKKLKFESWEAAVTTVSTGLEVEL
ncbi:Peptidase M28 [Gracilaria domingensis]|nr:Peptidase M28 [Gracilaria domingensis]